MLAEAGCCAARGCRMCMSLNARLCLLGCPSSIRSSPGSGRGRNPDATTGRPRATLGAPLRKTFRNPSPRDDAQPATTKIPRERRLRPGAAAAAAMRGTLAAAATGLAAAPRGAPHRLRPAPAGAGTPPLPTVPVAGPHPARVPRRRSAVTAPAVTAGGTSPLPTPPRRAHRRVCHERDRSCQWENTGERVRGRWVGEREGRWESAVHVQSAIGRDAASRRRLPGRPCRFPAGGRSTRQRAAAPPRHPLVPPLPDARHCATTSRGRCRPCHRRRPHRWRQRPRGRMPHRRQRGILCAAGPHPPPPAAASALVSGRCLLLPAAADAVTWWKSHLARQGRIGSQYEDPNKYAHCASPPPTVRHLLEKSCIGESRPEPSKEARP